MFDITICIGFKRIFCPIPGKNGNFFPQGTKAQAGEFTSDWYHINTYNHKETKQMWYNNSQDLDLFVLGQVYFRLDSPYTNTQLPEVNSKVIELYRNDKENLTKHIKGNYILFFFNKSQHCLEIILSKSCLYDLYYTQWQDCFVFSTSIRNLLSIDKSIREVNPVSLIEHSIFDYPLGHKSLFRNINWLYQGSACVVDVKGINIRYWHDWETEVRNSRQRYDWKDTKSATPELFNQILQQQMNGKQEVIAALTGGFDSRTVLAGMHKFGYNDVMYYAWGKPQSMDVAVSMNIAHKMHLNYTPLYLDDNYENEYVDRGLDAIRSSDGRATLRRANHFYSYSKLSNHSHLNFTGIFGSELLRPVSAIGHTFNKNFFEIIISNNREETIRSIYEREIKKNYLNPAYLEQYKEETIKSITEYFQILKKDMPSHLAMYIFHLKEGFIKYFGHEIHGTRFYVTTFSPYLDDEFVEYLLKTPLLNLNDKAYARNLKKNIWDSRKGQLFYIPIIKKNYPRLMHLNTERFYSPAQLASFLYPLSIAHAIIPFKLAKKHRAFGSEIWIKRFIKQFPELVALDNDTFSTLPQYQPDIFIDYAKQLSIRYWLSFVNNEL